MDKRTKNNEITLAILWKTVRERWLFLILALIIGATAGFVYSRFVATPVYSSSAEFVVVIKETANSNSSAVSSSYQQGTVQVAATYTKMIGGNVFSKEVASLYSANKTTQLSTRALQSMVKVQNEEDGSSFTVKVSSTNPKQAIELLRVYESLTPAYLATHSRYVDVVLTTYGEEAATPDSPNTKLNILLGGMLMAVVTYLIFFLISFLDKTVYEEETIKEQFSVPLIGTIPEWARTPEESKELARSRRALKRDLRLGLHSDRIVKGRLLGDTTPFSITEAFKTLRTNLIYVDTNGAKTPVFGIVSDLSGAGKSMIASNVAIGFTQLGKRVLLIDGDMRCPIQHRNFGLSRHKWGLSEALAGISANPLQECIQQTSYEGLDLMTCGRIPPNPNELLSSNQMKELLESAKETYDYILIDLPPVCATSDASVLAPLLNGYVLVARSAYSNLTALHDAFDLLNAVNANIVGIVLNDINPRQNSRYRGAGGRYSQYYPGAANRDEVTEVAPAEGEIPALPEQEQ